MRKVQTGGTLTWTGVVSPDLYASWKSLTVQRLSAPASVDSSRAGRQVTASWTRSAGDRSGFVRLTFCSGMSASTNSVGGMFWVYLFRGVPACCWEIEGGRKQRFRTFPAVGRGEQRRLRDVGVRDELESQTSDELILCDGSCDRLILTCMHDNQSSSSNIRTGREFCAAMNIMDSEGGCMRAPY
jgi:hypothetical protein